jgi:hypothetical protein
MSRATFVRPFHVFNNVYRGNFTQWRTEREGLEGFKTPPKFRIFDKAEPNSQSRGKYIRNNLIRKRVSLICKLNGTPD